MSFKKASVSASDAGGSIGTCGSVGGEEWTWLCCSASTSGSGPGPKDSSSVKGGRSAVALVGVGATDPVPEVGDSGTSEDFAAPNRRAFVGRVLLGLRFGASKRLIFGWMSQLGLRIAFPLGGGGLLEEPATLVLGGDGIGGGRDRGGCGAAGREWIGAGDEGAENKDDGESRLLVSPPRIGVAGYATFNEVDNYGGKSG